MNIVWKNPSPRAEGSTLMDFFQGFADGFGDDLAVYSRMMRTLFHALEEQPAATDLWAYTQLSHVWLYLAERRDTDVRVQVIAGAYELKSDWPEAYHPPWPEASLIARTTKPTQALRWILTALHGRLELPKRYRRSQPVPRDRTLPQDSGDPTPNGPFGWTTPLRRVSAQQPERLQDYFTHLRHEPGILYDQRAQAMLRLIQHLEASNIGADQWAYTSAIKLFLTNTDRMENGIKIDTAPSCYLISYPLTLPKTICDQVWAYGETEHVVTAAEMIRTAIQLTFTANDRDNSD